MEENKEAKVVNMPTREESAKPAQMSYEQLENVAHQLSNQTKQLYAKLQEANMFNTFKRLDYLFKVIEDAHAFNEEFVSKCVTEVEDLMTISDTEEKIENESKE